MIRRIDVADIFASHVIEPPSQPLTGCAMPPRCLRRRFADTRSFRFSRHAYFAVILPPFAAATPDVSPRRRLSFSFITLITADDYWPFVQKKRKKRGRAEK